MSCTEAELQTRIDTIDAKLRAGIESVTSDGTSTKVNLAELRKERLDLQKQLNSRRLRRPPASRIELGGF